MTRLSRWRFLLLSAANFLMSLVPGLTDAQAKGAGVKYDDASWHSGGDFPSDLPASAGATHIAMFAAWAMLDGLAGDLHREESAEDLQPLKNRSATPGQWFLSVSDGTFTDEDVNEDGNAFAQAYYATEKGLRGGPGSYVDDYEQAFPNAKTTYHVPDTWETYAKLEPVLTARFRAWRERRRQP